MPRESSHDTPSDRNLVEESVAGSAVALNALVVRHLPALRAFVRMQVGPALRQRESCSDLVQSVCRELLQGLDDFDFRGEEQFRHWLYVAALNKVRQRDRHFRAEKRDRAREQPLPDDAALQQAYASCFSPSRQAIARETIARLEAAVDALPPHYREVIMLSRVVGLTQEQVAETMGRSIPSVRNLLHRAIARLAGLADDG